LTTLGVSAARFLTPEETVIEQVVKVMPVIATFQLFDALATTLNGVLRGLGKQAIGSVISIVCYYFVAMPVSFTAAFKLGWELVGLWSGIAVALGL
jgi:multidrug resistance protein, MATE family